MLKSIIDMLNVDNWYFGDEYVQIAKGKYELPTSIVDIKDKAVRVLTTNKKI